MGNQIWSRQIQTVLELIQECYQEASVALEGEDVTSTVMTLFRNEDLEGIANYMEQRKLEKDFTADLQQFIVKWSARTLKSVE